MRRSTAAPQACNWVTTTSRSMPDPFGAKEIRINSIDEFENAFKQSLSDPGITIIDAPVGYTRNTDLFAHLHVADLYVSASGTCTPGRQLPLNCGRTGRYIT